MIVSANNSGLLSRRIGQDKHAQPIYADPVSVPCAIIELQKSVQRTQIRHDASASRGSAFEGFMKIAKILFPVTVSIGINDMFQIAGFTMGVYQINPRYDAFGVLDHIEIDFEILP